MIHANVLKFIMRKPARSILLFIIAMSLSGVLVVISDVSLNSSSMLDDALRLADVYAIPAFYANVTNNGEISTDSADVGGYYNVPAKVSEFDELRNLPGVISVNTWTQYGAYIDSENVVFSNDGSDFSSIDDVIVFTYNGEEPVEIDGFERGKYSSADAVFLPIEVCWSACGLEKYVREGRDIGIYNMQGYSASGKYEEAVKEMSLEDLWIKGEGGSSIDGTFVLAPGETYIATCSVGLALMYDSENRFSGNAEIYSIGIAQDPCHTLRIMAHVDEDIYDAEWGIEENQGTYSLYPPLIPFSGDFWSTDAGSFYAEASEVCRINRSCGNAVLTDDIDTITPFHKGDVYIASGRKISEDEYASGAKVCVVSQYLADINGWHAGDSIDLSLFESVYPHDSSASSQIPYYQPLYTGKFFDTSTYEIIGLYTGNVSTSRTESSLQYDRLSGTDRRSIYIPASSVTNVPYAPLSQYNTSLIINGTMVNEFLEASENFTMEKGLYDVSFELFDNGYAAMASGLSRISDFSLKLKLAGVFVSFAVLAGLFIICFIREKRSMAISVILGSPHRSSVTAGILTIITPMLVGGAVGLAIGRFCSVRIIESVMASADIELGNLFTVSTYSDSICISATVFIITLLILFFGSFVFASEKKVLSWIRCEE